jgi:hypothetical protein
MPVKILDQLEIKDNGSKDLGTPPGGLVALGVMDGKVVAVDASGDSVPIGSGHTILNGTGTALPARSFLKISGGDVVLADDAQGDTTLLTVNGDTGTPGHVIVDGEATHYTQRAKLVFEGPGVSSITDDATNDATIVNITGGGGSGDVTSYVSNCIIAAPPGYLTYSGNDISAESGLTVLIPSGLNADGTFADTTVTLAAAATVTQSLGPADFGIVFLLATGTLAVLKSSLYIESSSMPTDLANVVWYNSFENLARQFDASGTLVGTFSGAPIGTFATDADGDIQSIEAYGVTRINNYIHIRYWDL